MPIQNVLTTQISDSGFCFYYLGKGYPVYEFSIFVTLLDLINTQTFPIRHLYTNYQLDIYSPSLFKT